MNYTRVLKLGVSGDDVKFIKDCLYKLKYLKVKPTHNKFGNDTTKAVKDYQAKNKDVNGKALEVDGKVGKLTWGAIVRDINKASEPQKPTEPQPKKEGLLDKYTHISADKRKLIEADLEKVSDIRKKICLEILDYAYDKDVPGDVRALYIFGANLYDTKKQLNYADAAEVEKSAKAHPTYFNGGRKEWMLAQIKKNPKLPSSDCSGMEVGYLRKYDFVKPTFDATANGLCGDNYSKKIDKSQLKPGDFVGKDGHIGTYVGGGYVVEFAGGAYGAQITTVKERICYDFLKKKNVKLSNWTKFRCPKYY